MKSKKPPKPPEPIPPVRESGQEVAEARKSELMKNRKRRGLAATIARRQQGAGAGDKLGGA